MAALEAYNGHRRIGIRRPREVVGEQFGNEKFRSSQNIFVPEHHAEVINILFTKFSPLAQCSDRGIWYRRLVPGLRSVCF